jgi:hypothetical protein
VKTATASFTGKFFASKNRFRYFCFGSSEITKDYADTLK